MAASCVSPKGQVTIPQALRERLGFRPGDEVEFIEVEGGLRVQKRREGPPSPATGAISATCRGRTLMPS
jgi:AbrB family looped-hinge helix DNA binding protein